MEVGSSSPPELVAPSRELLCESMWEMCTVGGQRGIEEDPGLSGSVRRCYWIAKGCMEMVLAQLVGMALPFLL